MFSEHLNLRHKELLYEKLKAIDIPISEYSFPNAYLFRNAHNYEVLVDKDIFLRGRTYDGYTYLMPTRAPRDTDVQYLKEMMRTVAFLFPVSEAWLPFFPADDFQFHYMEQALFILDSWQSDAGLSANQTDFLACREALKLYDELALCGGIYYADGEPAGFVAGEELNPETFALHFAKARKKFKGVYQYMFNSFAKILPPKYWFLNFEQDLDKEPLRIAKTSYTPDSMLKKFRVTVK